MNFLDLLAMYQPKTNQTMQDGIEQGQKLGQVLSPMVNDAMERWKMRKKSAATTQFIQNQPMQLPNTMIG